MKHSGLFVTPFALALCGATIGVAQAQPDPGVAPKAQNPPQAQPFNGPIIGGPMIRPWMGGFAAGGAFPGGAVPGGVPMIQMLNPGPMQGQMIQAQLAQAGFTDKALQDAVVEFAKAQEKARQPLRDKAQKLTEAARGNVVTDKQLATLINDYRAAVEDEKTRNEEALKSLDAKVGYTKKPRLEAVLMMLGLMGYDAAFLGGGPMAGGNFAFGGNLPLGFGNNMVVNGNGQLPGGRLWIGPGAPNPGGKPGVEQFFGGGGQFFIQPGPNGQAQPFVWGLPPGAVPGLNPNIRNFGLVPNGVPGDVLQVGPGGDQVFVMRPPNAFQWQVKPGQPGAAPVPPKNFRYYQTPNGGQLPDQAPVAPRLVLPKPAPPAPVKPLPDQPNDEVHL